MRVSLCALMFALMNTQAVAQTAAFPPAGQAKVTFDRNRILTMQANGVADRSTGRLTTVDDPVRVASISKLVVALGVMRLVEAGKLDLDADVSIKLGWSLRNPAFPDKAVTLRQLLSHQSSLTDGADYLVPLGERLQDRLSNPKAWDAINAPGGYFRYANINFPVIASVMEKATGERFDKIMTRIVFKPLKLDAGYNWSGVSAAKVARAVVLYDISGPVRRDDLRGVLPPCLVFTQADGKCDLSLYNIGDNGALFSPQGGMRISMRDLARIGQLLLRGGKGFLKPASMKMLTTPQWRFNGSNGESEGGFFCRYALAVQTLATSSSGCKDDPFGDERPRIGHAGEAYGLRSGLWVDQLSGKGIAFFTSAVPDDEPKGKSAFSRAEEVQIQGEPGSPHK
jgi:CubicO group peptidase (beta-lactamase class C family)